MKRIIRKKKPLPPKKTQKQKKEQKKPQPQPKQPIRTKQSIPPKQERKAKPLPPAPRLLRTAFSPSEDLTGFFILSPTGKIAQLEAVGMTRREAILHRMVHYDGPGETPLTIGNGEYTPDRLVDLNMMILESKAKALAWREYRKVISYTPIRKGLALAEVGNAEDTEKE